MIPWKLFWVALGAVVTLAAGVVPALFDVPAYAVIPGVALAGIAIGVGVAMFVPISDMFRPLPSSTQQFISRCISAGVFLHVAWVAALALSPSWLLWWPLGVLVLAGAEWAWCEAHDYIMTRRPEKPKVPTTAEGRPLDEIESRMASALKQAGHSRVAVQDWDSLVDESGKSFGATFRVQLPITRGVSGK